MRIHQTADAVRYVGMDTNALRATFMIESLFQSGMIDLTLTDLDRAVVGSAVPAATALALPSPDALRADHFCQRRELGILNIGGAGTVSVDGRTFDLAHRDALYVGRGSRRISFASTDQAEQAHFYLLSYPAHADYPTTLIRHADANVVRLGSDDEANRRTIHQYIHEEGVRSCQLVMGFTELASGSVWNTMPAHTHARRTEIYTYFNIPSGHRVFHLLGRPEETRHLCVADRCAVLSPSWSLHSGVGTTNYAFIWGMGGENQAFADMDGVGIDALH
ncbi:MAG: 5-dehydro-4-deoxy-D-glucuronate isomerase [Phycisphaerales bacterium]|nr:MAG: 5-dehydro-4-deoxy-D-glucuronate isomerase [Phycisphaerales bacterium]